MLGGVSKGLKRFCGTAELSPWSWGTLQDCLLGCSWVSGQGITRGEPSPASQAFPNTKPFAEPALTNLLLRGGG